MEELGVLLLAVIIFIVGIAIGYGISTEFHTAGYLRVTEAQCREGNLEILIKDKDYTLYWKSLGVECE